MPPNQVKWFTATTPGTLRTLFTYDAGSRYVSPASWWTEMRVFDVALSRIAVSALGSDRTAQTRKIDSAIESVVKRLRSGWRKRFRMIRRPYVNAGLRRSRALLCGGGSRGRRTRPRVGRA